MMDCGYFDTTRNANHSSFLAPTLVGGRRPLASEICAQSDPSHFEKRRLKHISAYNVSTVRDSERSSTMTNTGNVAINDVLPLKAARRDAIVNLKCFGALDTRDLISMVTFTCTMRRHLIRLASAPFISSRLFGNVWLGSVFVCNAWEAQYRIYEGWVRTLRRTLSSLDRLSSVYITCTGTCVCSGLTRCWWWPRRIR